MSAPNIRSESATPSEATILRALILAHGKATENLQLAFGMFSASRPEIEGGSLAGLDEAGNVLVAMPPKEE